MIAASSRGGDHLALGGYLAFILWLFPRKPHETLYIAGTTLALGSRWRRAPIARAGLREIEQTLRQRSRVLPPVAAWPKVRSMTASPTMSLGTQRLLRFAGIWTAASLLPTVVLLLIGQPFWANWILDARGVTTEGEVLSEEALPNDSHDGGNSIIDIRVRFHDQRGRAFILEGYNVAGRWSIRSHETKRVTVEYDPEDPSRHRLKGGSASTIGYWVLMPMGFLLVGVMLLGFGLHMARRDRVVLTC